MSLYFKRPKMVEDIRENLMGKSYLSEARSGLFLSAPRRVGKTAFLKNELLPDLEQQGCVTVYVDLWSDKSRSPGALIAEAVGIELKKHRNPLAKVLDTVGITQLGGDFLKLEPGNIGRPGGATLAQALQALHEASKKPIALVVDEAQQSLASEEGMVAMAALKSARDTLNTAESLVLMLLMTGSDRDKLLRLVTEKNAPFLGAHIRDFKLLDDAFVEHVASSLANKIAPPSTVGTEQLKAAFPAFGNRPEMFLNSVKERLLSMPVGASLGDQVLADSANYRDSEMLRFDAAFQGLSAVQQAVLARALEAGGAFQAFNADSMAFYKARCPDITASKVQVALDTMRRQDDSLLWKSARGDYAVGDSAMYEWYERRKASGQWPTQPESSELDEPAPPSSV